jgi:cellobiose phosphorylase
MSVSGKTIRERLLSLRAAVNRRHDPAIEYAGDEPPLRAELFGRDRMEQHGKSLARSHRLNPKQVPDQLAARLNENERVLTGVRDLLTEAVNANRRITPAGEWLLDNFYLIEEQIRTARRHLPRGYARELPRLLDGPSARLPRVYDIALETISHGDGHVKANSLRAFVAAYQAITPLTLGELWAIPIMLRLALLENLRRIGARIAAHRRDRNRADYWADRMTEIAEKDPKSLILVIADMARSAPPMASAFVAELARRLQGQGPALALPLTWIEQRLWEGGQTIERLVQSENQQQATERVSISNSIDSLRRLGATDWRAFVETMSIVEQTLREDPDGVYRRMDFATRDRYRHVVEETAKRGRLSEGEVARRSIEMAQEAAATGRGDHRASHVGYYLVGSGFSRLERAAGVRVPASEALRRRSVERPLLLYLGMVSVMTAVPAAALVAQAGSAGAHGWLLGLVGLLALLCASHLAVALANWAAAHLATPAALPRMDLSAGIPPELRTLVVVPTFLTSAQGVEATTEALEVLFLANRDDNLYFGLLTDFRDAPHETLPEDEPLLHLAEKRINELNEKYRVPVGAQHAAPVHRTPFFLLHRPRRWNPGERLWMGYERKRGKLADLNALLRGHANGRFSRVVGATGVLPQVKYVITLDADTGLPRGAARQLVGAMAHPLNRPRYDEHEQRVSEGYGILQPRVAASLPGTNRSRYARLSATEPGIDPYTHVVSDVYQDLFGEGSFIGKGIYDVDIFERALGGRFPENRVLSHDLIEGCYARAGFLSDVQVYEEYPARYETDMNRRYRWIRGDWQLSRWLLPRVPGLGGRRQKNPLSGLSRWKLFDNLRRSLTPAAFALLLLVAWGALSPLWWTVSVVGFVLVPSLVASAQGMLRRPEDVLAGQHVATTARSTARHFTQAVLAVACLPYEAFLSLDAIARTAVRMLVTHRRLLEWNPSGDIDRPSRTSLAAACRRMWIAPALAAASAIALSLGRPAALAVAGPILGLWFAAPVVAWWISRTLPDRGARLTADECRFLRRISRKTWRFFETFVGPDDHWLPPDNYQEHPRATVGHRTSPTNMGLTLLANLGAYDFGYISAGQLLERTAHALDSMARLERHRGHFYNWYDTGSLTPLPPLYVSSIDSGNLAGHLLTLSPGLLALPDDPILGVRVFEGLEDTFANIVDVGGIPRDSLDELGGSLRAVGRVFRPANGMGSANTSLAAARESLTSMATRASSVAVRLDGLPAGADPSVCPETGRPGAAPAADNSASWWTRALVRQCRDGLDELALLAPWAALPPPSDRLRTLSGLDEVPSLRQVAGLEVAMRPALDRLADEATPEEHRYLAEVRRLAGEASARARARIAETERLARQCNEFARMEWDFLFDQTRHLLAVGYNVGEHRRDKSYYDLLASEARLCSFVAIAQGQLPQESWFAFGRLLTTAAGAPVLLSWSGSMFEYLMPLLVMPTYENTLLDETCKAAVKRQIEYGRTRGAPWGISESGYNLFDVRLTYQYRAFGVPGLGLKRGLAEDLVVAPYASALALMVAPEEACRNLQRLAAEGFEGDFGFYEAVDYTPSRVPRGQSNAIVRSFMAHHQGMAFLSLANLILDRRMQKRFESEPLFQATLLLLQERVPRTTAFHLVTAQLSGESSASQRAETAIRVFTGPDTRVPEVHLLSNGRYHVMVTNGGGGYSRWKDLAVTRWREDTTCDDWGSFCYIRDLATGAFWSTAYQPTRQSSEHFEAVFSEARAEFRSRNHEIETHTEIAVSPEDDIELRRIHIRNCGRTRRPIDVTSYAEVALGSAAADALHPAFHNLFVQTEILPEQGAILCSRRPRSRGEQSPWMFHLMAMHSAQAGQFSYETDRLRFIGRGRTVAEPRALLDPAPLSGSQGSVLDPIVAIRGRLTLDPDESVTIDIVSGIGETRDGCLGLVAKYQDRPLASRVFSLAWTHSEVVLRQINATEADAQTYARLAGSIIYANNSLRADPAVLVRNRRGQSGLWGYSISGDLPIVLLQIGDAANIELVRQMVQAHAYWRLKGLAVDLVIWNEDHAGYRQLLQQQIIALISAGIETSAPGRPGSIYVRPIEQISNEDRVLFQSVARAIITDSRGSLADQVARSPVEIFPGRLVPTRAHRPEPDLQISETPQTAKSPPGDPPRRDLIFFNGLGGFTPDGREYVTTTSAQQVTPAPWVNVLANRDFGSVISESGAAYSWSENAHEFRLTPWNNDPVTDAGGEAFYLRDEESGHFWSPTPLPSGAVTSYTTRHGFGYSVFEHTEGGITSELWVYVAMDAPVKFSVLKVRNNSGRPRQISATGYVEWVLGDLRPKTSSHIITGVDRSGALLAGNRYNTEFTGRTAFFDVDDASRSVSGDRAEFIGRNGTLRYPAAMGQARLSGRVGAALDPCGALQVPFDLADGQQREVVFTLGAGRDAEEAVRLVHRFRGALAAQAALEAVRQYWNHALGSIQVETPDPSLNVLANGWLLYQTIGCRLRARSGFYQSAGAFGFRDQLQDVMAVVHADPGLVREHLLLCASRQFREGDVQHWWHPPSGRGVRTHCSDDYLWLPLAACRYVTTTGDTGVLDESVHFIEGRAVKPEEDSYYDLPGVSEDSASLYEHCVRAILHGLRFGAHRLPFIGSGDWNDAMNMVGAEGKGESVWLGFFLYAVLVQFSALAVRHGDAPFAERCQVEAARLRQDLEQAGWDGAWYRRAYFDDGTPLGSASNPECQIDSIAQSWSVLSGAGDAARARMAMNEVDARLVRRDHALVQLLDPPFDTSDLNPGYIKGYVPGVRENGGQYTHAAIWAAMAFAQLGDRRRAWELWKMINPVNHATSPQACETYKVEPYVVAADVYALSPHIGRGGWTWYTGSAGWLYQLAVESLLGLTLVRDTLRFAPCLPPDWNGFTVHYRYRETVYHIAVRQTRGAGDEEGVTVDGVEQAGGAIPLVDDRRQHSVEVRVRAVA